MFQSLVSNKFSELFSESWWKNMGLDPEFQYYLLEIEIGEQITILAQNKTLKILSQELGVKEEYLINILKGINYTPKVFADLKNFENTLRLQNA